MEFSDTLLEEVERKHILATLKQTEWVVSGPRGAAARLGLNRSTLYFRMKKLGISRSFDANFSQQEISAVEHKVGKPIHAAE
jgi:DNA-binding NtrC family response regulator